MREGERCTAVVGGETAVFPGLADGDEYVFTLCVESWFDGTVFGAATTTASVRAQQTGRAPRGYTFVVDATPNVSDGRAEWIVRAQPTSDERVPNRNRVEFAGMPSSIFDRDPGILVRYVHEFWGTATPWATVTPRAGSAPYQVRAQWSVQSCVGGSNLVAVGDSSSDAAGGKAAITFGNAGLRYYDASGALPAAHGRHVGGAGRRRARRGHHGLGELERAVVGPLAGERDLLGILRSQHPRPHPAP